ncbi:MAG: hypothetical protein FJX29_09770 [Alphaproteobacteria bacterium]|nr:hypothetical protein [Alphaproteobacteria bacterium]
MMASLPRLGLIGGLIAGLILAGAGAVWFRASLDAAFDKGEAQGRMTQRDEAQRQTEKLRAASEAALEKSNRDAAALAGENAKLQEKLDELVQAIAASSGAGSVCLDADVVRALAAIGARDSPFRPRP